MPEQTAARDRPAYKLFDQSFNGYAKGIPQLSMRFAGIGGSEATWLQSNERFLARMEHYDEIQTLLVS